LENIMPHNTSTRLTDTLERALLAKAMEDQFRFRPLRAVSKFIHGVASFAASARANGKLSDMV
jgi:hypothetical protein